MSELQKRHSELIADVVKGLHLSAKDRSTVARAFCLRLARTNPQFKSTRFLAACGDEESEDG